MIKKVVSNAIATDKFFGDIKRAEIFEKTDFVVPKITIDLSNVDYNQFFLKYQCERDMNIRYLTKNEECYKASWMNYDSILENAFNLEFIDKSKITESKDLELIKKSNKTLSEFESIISKYTNFTIEEILSTGYGLFKIPDYEVDKAGLTFDVDG
ncbi:hypothetical protein LY90DRAFT_507297 [Neocallimastix californiae]|uniref:Uncharacterized protein n=1 Tax=Neocallimastix californiae TaxID=1754190 RepID=A0A1Y2D6Z7_9FUNG|nr:hypothetical protein LY90DRAFT_507297 [Neocallimastix californiae]|eukprot:ORY55058.1 hypothetical protein LY90DRAFT_507297 [Neocallimastix californiae]